MKSNIKSNEYSATFIHLLTSLYSNKYEMNCFTQSSLNIEKFKKLNRSSYIMEHKIFSARDLVEDKMFDTQLQHQHFLH